MSLRPSFKLAFFALFVFAAFPMLAQTVPAGESGNSASISAGVGASDFDTDFGDIRMEGVSVWADWIPALGPKIARGLGVEIEGRDVHFGNSGGLNHRMDTGLGGLIYNFRSFHNIRPYVKGLMGLGSIDYLDVGGPTHATLMLFAPGGGVDYPFRRISIRGDFEYQFWPNFLREHTLNPNGFTVGFSYRFSRVRSYQR